MLNSAELSLAIKEKFKIIYINADDYLLKV